MTTQTFFAIVAQLGLALDTEANVSSLECLSEAILLCTSVGHFEGLRAMLIVIHEGQDHKAIPNMFGSECETKSPVTVSESVRLYK